MYSSGFNKIPTGYTQEIDGFYYKFYKQKKNWNDAQKKCASEGGNLAIIYSDQMRDVVKGLIISEGWIGLTDQWSSKAWQAPDRKDVAYINGEWNKSEGDCVQQRKDGKWINLSCSLQLPFICQLEPGKIGTVQRVYCEL